MSSEQGYGHEILTADEEVALAISVEAGRYAVRKLADAEAAGVELDDERREGLRELEAEGAAARQEFMEKNHGLVYLLAKKYLGSGLEIDELAAFGYGAVEGAGGPMQTGLIHAIEKFDYRQGYKFSTYASNWILAGLQAGVARQRMAIQLPQNLRITVASLSRVRERLTARIGRMPDDDELADEMGMKKEALLDLKNLHQRFEQTGAVKSLEGLAEATAHDSGSAGREFATDSTYDPGGDRQLEHLALGVAYNKLTARQRTIVAMTFGLDGEDAYDDVAIARHIGYDEKTGRTIYTVGALRNDRAKALAVLRGMVAEDDMAVRPASEAYPGQTRLPELLPEPSAMSYGELLADSRFNIAVERLLALCTPDQRRLLAARFPDSWAAVYRTKEDVPFQKDWRNKALRKTQAMLRSIIDDSFDYGAQLPDYDVPRHFLQFMSAAGMAIPPQASLEDLFAAASTELAEVKGISDYAKDMIANCYGLSGDEQLTVAELAANHGITARGVSSVIREATQTIAKNAALAKAASKPTAAEAVRELASQIPLEAWLNDQSLRIVAERGLSLLTDQRAAIIEGTFGWNGDAKSRTSLMEELSLTAKGLRLSRQDARNQLESALPAIAAGEYDYTAQKGGSAYHQSVLECMAHCGMYIPPDANIAALREGASRHIDAADILSAEDKRLLKDYYGLGLNGDQRPAPATEIARGYGWRTALLRERVINAMWALLKVRRDNGDVGTLVTEPLVSAPELRYIAGQQRRSDEHLTA